MPPAVTIVTLYRRRRWMPPLVLPVFLLWPFLMLAVVGVAVATRFRSRVDRPSLLGAMRTSMGTVTACSGLRFDVRSADGDGVRVWVV